MNKIEKILKSWRIDIKNHGISNSELIIQSPDSNVTAPSWFTNYQGIGNVIQGSTNHQKITVKTKNSGTLNILFKGIKEVFNDKKLVVYANYTSIKINNQEVLFKNEKVWHDKPYKVVIPVYKDQEIKIEFQINYNTYSKDEFDLLLSVLSSKYQKVASDADIERMYCTFLDSTNEVNYRKLFNYPNSVISLDSITKETKGRINIVCDNVTFPSVIIPSNNKKIYVFPSAIGKNTTSYPSFLRKSWSNYFNGICLYFDDPTRYLNNFAPAFFFGEKNKSYLLLIKRIVLSIAKLYDIDNKDITFIGSSNGGYASLYLADAIEYSKAITFCPQVSIPLYFSEKNFSFEKRFEVSFNNPDEFNRFDVFRICHNFKSKFFIYSNVCDYNDAKQMSALLENCNVQNFQGLKKITSNLTLCITNIPYNNPHVVQPDESFTKIIDMYLNSNLVDDFTFDAFIQSMKHTYKHLYDFQSLKDSCSYKIDK